jgi:hypothetical protein
MEIVLKDIRVDDRLSDDSTCFSATMYIDGVRAGVARNDGNGGMTDYRSFDKQGKQLIKEAEEYCQGLPPFTAVGAGSNGEDVSVRMDLSIFIEDLLIKYLNEREGARFDKRLEKAMESSIVVGIPGKSFGGWKMKFPIEHYLSKEKWREILKLTIENRVVPDLKPGEFILNNNLPADFVATLKVGADKLQPAKKAQKEEFSREDQKEGRRRNKR